MNSSSDDDAEKGRADNDEGEEDKPLLLAAPTNTAVTATKTTTTTTTTTIPAITGQSAEESASQPQQQQQESAALFQPLLVVATPAAPATSADSTSSGSGGGSPPNNNTNDATTAAAAAAATAFTAAATTAAASSQSSQQLIPQPPPPPPRNFSASSFTTKSPMGTPVSSSNKMAGVGGVGGSAHGTTSSSRQSSRAPSPTSSDKDFSDELPSNVSTPEQLRLLPQECISGDPIKPLRHIDEMGGELHYALKPMFYSVIFILLIELLERFAFYGINYTQTSYLTGVYNQNWNADMEAVTASSYVSISVAVAYSTPFVGAMLADSILGDYYTILFGAVFFYLPGLLLIALTTIPGFLGAEFNRSLLAVGLLVLWPLGTGTLKSVINILGAKQFHPLLQSSLIEAYYVKFYMCINIGALVGGVAVPVVAQHNVTQAYFLPVVVLSCGVLLFVMGTSRYVRTKPKGSLFKKHKTPIIPGSDSIGLDVIFRISCLVVPFNIAYSQMATTFIIQGTVMHRAFGFIDAAMMNNADAVSVLLFGYVIGSKFYPWLSHRGIKIPTTYKFAIGSGLGALAIGYAILLDEVIKRRYNETGDNVSIMWQSVPYILIGAGEIFAVSAAYEVAFTASPPEKKVLASAVNLFCIGGLPNTICIALYNICRPWFRNSRGTTNITHLEDYASANVSKYFWVLLIISICGVFVNLLPCVRTFVESVEERATDMIKSPKTPTRPPRRERREEESPLIRIRRRHAYFKYGTGPDLTRQSSMRAGQASVSERPKKNVHHLKKSMIPKLYRSDPTLPGVLTAGGAPITAGALLKLPRGAAAGGGTGGYGMPLSQSLEEFHPIERSSSG